VSASVNLPLHHKVQKFSSGTGSPGWSRKKGRKTVVVCRGYLFSYLLYILLFMQRLTQFATYNPAKMHFIELFWPSKMTWFCGVDHRSLGVATAL